MHGDRRNFCVALVTFDPEATAKWAADKGLAARSYAELAAEPLVHDLLFDVVKAVNAMLPSYQTIKAIHVLDHDLSIESGELTPTMKVKRSVVEARHKAILDAFYKDSLIEV